MHRYGKLSGIAHPAGLDMLDCRVGYFCSDSTQYGQLNDGTVGEVIERRRVRFFGKSISQICGKLIKQAMERVSKPNSMLETAWMLRKVVSGALRCRSADACAGR